MKAALPLLAYLAALLVASQISSGLSLPSTYNTVPAFLWSPHYHQVEAAINYRTIFSQVCFQKGAGRTCCALAMKFISLWTLLLSSLVQSCNLQIFLQANMLIQLLWTCLKSITQSNFSMAFPCISASAKDAMESSLVSGMSEICGQNFGFSIVCFLESCSMWGDDVQKLSDLHSVHDYLLSRMEKRPNGEADLVVFCHKGSDSKKELEPPHSESKKFSEMVSFVDQSGAKYAVLYVSDPIKSIQYPSH